jgi:trimethylamine-N-oxide reductase (cytochrome c)
MFYRYGGSFIGTMSDTNKWVKMYQSDELEFVVNQDIWYQSETKFADVILPACTNLEREDIAEWAACGGYTTNAHIGCNYRVLVREQKCIEPIGESKSDYDILTLIADRLGMKEKFTEGKTDLDWCKAFFESSDIAKNGSITWEELNEKGYYLTPVPDDYKPTPGMRWFVEGRDCDTPDANNPKLGTDKANELGTYTGKIEFVSESLKQNMPDDEERPLIPHFIPSWEGYRSEPYKKYPLQIILPHPRFSFHTHYDNHTAWLDDIPVHRVKKDGYAWWPARINPKNALERGIKSGDIVELYNDRASVLCIADVTDRVPVGVLHSYGCTAKYDPLVPGMAGSTEKGGCVNMLTSSRMLSKHAPGMTPNSCVCEIRKWEG